MKCIIRKVLCFFVLSLLVTGCAKPENSEETTLSETTEAVSVQETSSAEQLAALKDRTVQFLTTAHTSDEIENTLLSAFEQLSKADCTEITDYYIYGTYNASQQYELSDEETNKLTFILDENGKFDYSKLEDESLKKKLSDLGEQHIILRFVNGAMFYDVDYGYFEKAFGKYLNEDYDQMLKFYHEEKVNNYTDDANTVLYTDIVEGRLDNLYEQMQKYKACDTYYVFEEAYLFYKSVYLGAYGNPYVWDDSGKIKDTVLSAYREYAKTTKDPEMSAFLTDLVERLDVVGGVRTVPIFEDIKSFCKFSEE